MLFKAFMFVPLLRLSPIVTYKSLATSLRPIIPCPVLDL